MPPGEAVMTGVYDFRIVVLSVLIAITASYTALVLVGRVMATAGTSRRLWLAGGATVMGLGIWSMHYIGMLAFHLPIPVDYDWPTVLASLLAAVLASGVALFVATRPRVGWANTGVGSVFMGAGIAAMHYLGMAAMRLAAMCHYNGYLVALSILLAIVVSFVGLRLLFALRDEENAGARRKAITAAVMGAAIPLMHYTGMAAATFTPSNSMTDTSRMIGVDRIGMAAIATVTFVVLGLTVLHSMLDRKYSARSSQLKLAERRYQLLFERSLAGGLRTTTTMDGQILDCNEACARIFGFSSREEMMATSMDG